MKPGRGLGFKALGVLAVVMTLLFTANRVVFDRVVMPGFMDHEQEMARAQLLLVSGAVERDIGHLDTLAAGWAAWDDIWDRAVDRDPAGLNENLLTEAVEGAGVDLIFVYDIEGRPRWGGFHDPRTGEHATLADFPADDPPAFQGLLDHRNTGGGISGVIGTAAGPMLVAARPIVTGAGGGPPRGTLVMGRLVTPEYLEILSRQLGFTLEMTAAVPAGDPVVAAGDSLTLHVRIAGIDGGDGLMLSARRPRTMVALGAEISSLAFGFLLVTAVVLLLGVWILLQVSVVCPLARLAADARKVGDAGRPGTRIPVRRRDEIGALTRTVNSMLDRLESRDREVREQLSRGAEAEGHLVNALAHLTQGVCLLDADLRIVARNDRLLELYEGAAALYRPGATIRDVIRGKAEQGDLGPGDVDARVAGLMDDFLERVMLRREQIGRDGRIIEILGVPLPDGGWVITYTDITGQREIEDRLRLESMRSELASQAKSDFLANISHELRTPLNAIIGFSDIMRTELFGAIGREEYRDYAADIHDSGAHLLSLINELLDLSKIEAGYFELFEEQVDVGDIVSACLRLMRERAAARDVALASDFSDTLPELWCDARALRQIVLNLLTNAVKFTPAGGAVRIDTATSDDGELGIRISDTGIGMSPEELEKAMMPFGQVDSSMTRSTEGTGLGLPLVKSLVELHGGRLAIDTAPGEGTAAVVWFPADRLRAAPEASAAPCGASDAAA